MNAEPGRPPAATGVFSLEGRPGAGLYVTAWLLASIGLGLLFLALVAGPAMAGILLVVGVIPLALGLSAAAGYQLVARARVPPTRYRGPSPLILFGLQLLLANALGAVILLGLGLPDPRENPLAFVGVSASLLASYALIVWLFVVRSGALSWREMGMPAGSGVARYLGDAAYGAAAMAILWWPITLFAGLVATLLGTRNVQIVPISREPLDLAVVVLGAALLVPIGEELLFRGVALTAWLRERGVASAWVRSSLFFALVHTLNVVVEPSATAAVDGARQALLTVVAITPVGAALGWIFLRRGLVASIAGHAMFNLIGVIALTVAQSLAPPA